MTWQERVLPESDQELLIAWELCERSYAETAMMYGCAESSVRARVKKALKRIKETK